MCSTRSQRAASSVSWVTRTSVVPRSRWPRNSSSMMSRAGGLVEIAGRFVGDDDGGIGRERAGERDALLLAAGKLGRIMVHALCQARRRPIRARRGKARRMRRRVRAAQRRFPAPSWSGSDERPERRCRSFCRESGRVRSSSSRLNSSPATMTEPESGRSSPVITMSSVDLPEPEGPRRPTASPRPILRAMSRRMWTRAAPRPSDRLTPPSTMASPAKGCPEMSFMPPTGSDPASGRRRPLSAPVRSYGWRRALRQIAAVCSVALVAAIAMHRARAAAPIHIVALGNSLTAGYGLAEKDGFVPRLQAALAKNGIAAEIANAGVSGDTASDGLARLDWSVPQGTDGGHRRARRQRHAARHQARGDARRARCNLAPADGTSHFRLAMRHAGGAKSRRRLRSGVRAHLSRTGGEIWRAALPVLSRRRCRGSRVSPSKTACTRIPRVSA